MLALPLIFLFYFLFFKGMPLFKYHSFAIVIDVKMYLSTAKVIIILYSIKFFP